MFHRPACWLIAVCLLTAPAQAKLFLNIEGIEGDSTAKGRGGWIEIDSFGIGVKSVDNAGRPAGARFTPLRIEAPSSSASPEIFLSVAEGRIIPSVQLDIDTVFPDGKLRTVAYWKLANARIGRYESFGEETDSGTVVRDEFDIFPGDDVTYGYNSYDEQNKLLGNVEVTWNVATNTTSTASTGTVTGFQFLTGGVDVTDLPYLDPVPTKSTPLPGDYNTDGTVDVADYTVWRDNLGAPAGTLANDLTGEPVGAAQYEQWKTNFGATGAASSVTVAVPEPASVAALLAGVGLAGAIWRWPVRRR